MLSIIKQHSFTSLLIVLGFFLLMNIGVILGFHQFSIKDVTAFTAFIFNKFDNKQLIIIGIIIVVIQAFWLNNILYKKRYSQKLGYVPALSFIAAHSLFPDSLILNPVLIANFFIIGVIYLMLDNQSENRVQKDIFNSGLCIAFATMFFPFYFFLILFGLAGLLYLRPFKLKETIIFMLGFLVPFLWLMTALFVSDNFHFIYELRLLQIANINYNNVQFNWINGIRIVFILFVFLSVLFTIQNNYFRTIVAIRRLYFVSILLFTFSFLIFIIKIGFKDVDIRVLALPNALFLTYFIMNIEHKKWSEGIFWGIISLICALQFIYL